MPITANVTNEQITANVGETKIDVSVGGGVGPTGATGPVGPAGSSYTLPTATASVLGGVKIGSGVTITDGVISVSTNYAASLHTHNASEVSYDPLDVATSATDVQSALEDIENAIETRIGAGQYATTNDWGIVKIGSGVSVLDGVISVSTNYAASSHTHTLSSITDAGTAAGKSVPTTGNASSTQVVLGSDTRLTDDRYPTSHNTSHWTDGSDPLGPADIGAAAALHAHSAADITSGTVATARLGSGTASSSTFLRGDGTWAAAGSTNASDLTSGTLAYARMGDPTVTSPSQITGNQNDYASFARGINRFSTNAARDITGMVAGSDGEVRVLCNTGTTAANTLTIKDESTSSTAANRFSVPWNGDCVIPAEGSVVVFYDGTSSRWRVMA